MSLPQSGFVDTESGLTLLEVLIGLAIVSAVTSIVALSVRLPPATALSPREAVLGFLSQAWTSVQRLGQAEVLTIDDGQMRFGGNTFRWDASQLSVSADPQQAFPITAVLFPDGTVAAPHLVLRDGAGILPLRWIYLPSP